ncbi:MAG: hypothetical protein J6I76_00645 [Oribacterium sp.]|nr:hypothetical protein [Oribacterium sp.]
MLISKNAGKFREGDSVKNTFHHYLCRRPKAAEWVLTCMTVKGAMIGDILGSPYEFRRVREYDWKTVPGKGK